MNALDKILNHRSHDTFIAEDTVTYSYGDAVKAIGDTRALLSSKGVSPHDVVALHIERERSSIITLLALLDMRCTALLIHSRWPQTMLTEALERVGARHVVSTTTRDDIEVASLSHEKSKPSWATDAAVIVATSGSTGIPKLALLPLSNLLASAHTSAPACSVTAQDRWLLSLPLFHVGGLGILFRTLVTGSSLSLSRHHEHCGDAKVTHLSLVPTQLYRLLNDAKSRDNLRLKKVILLGGAPIGERIISECLEIGIPIVTTYGLTEMSSTVTLSSARPVVIGGSVSLGRPLPGREIRLASDGEVLTRGEPLFKGYITAEGLSLPLLEEGWFPTGDIGHILSDGTLAILGRRDAQFISGGENIHPEMIENALTSLPGIIAACVVPIPDEEFGHRPFAFVVTERVTLSNNEIRDSLRSMIPAFALPITIQEAKQDLLTPTGKISRPNAQRAALGSPSI